MSNDVVTPFRKNYGTKEHPCYVPPPPDPKPEIPEGAEPLGDDWTAI